MLSYLIVFAIMVGLIYVTSISESYYDLNSMLVRDYSGNTTYDYPYHSLHFRNDGVFRPVAVPYRWRDYPRHVINLRSLRFLPPRNSTVEKIEMKNGQSPEKATALSQTQSTSQAVTAPVVQTQTQAAQTQAAQTQSTSQAVTTPVVQAQTQAQVTATPAVQTQVPVSEPTPPMEANVGLGSRDLGGEGAFQNTQLEGFSSKYQNYMNLSQGGGWGMVLRQ